NEQNTYIVHSWVSHYKKENSAEAPFIISPSLIKLAPNEKFTLTIDHNKCRYKYEGLNNNLSNKIRLLTVLLKKSTDFILL
uniref:fimbria/pilus periplasmic chaperone n=1 Tax=Proteus faecis TaxID=2050967 RepID=UPI0020C12907